MDAISYAHADDAYGKVVIIENEGRVFYKTKTDSLSDLPLNMKVIITDIITGPVEFLIGDNPYYNIDSGESYDDLIGRNYEGFVTSTEYGTSVKSPKPILSLSHDTQNESAKVIISITNYDGLHNYTVNVSGGEFNRNNNIITWTLPKVELDSLETISVFSVGAGELVSDSVEESVLVKNIVIALGQELLYDNTNIHTEFYGYNNYPLALNYISRVDPTYWNLNNLNINININSHNIKQNIIDETLMTIDEDYSNAYFVSSPYYYPGIHKYNIDGTSFEGEFVVTANISDDTLMADLKPNPDATPFNVDFQDSSMVSLTRAGPKNYIGVGSTNNTLYSYTKREGEDFSYDNKSLYSGDGAAREVQFSSSLSGSNEGKKMYVLQGGAVAITEYTLSEAYDISTVISQQVINLGNLYHINSAQSFTLSPDGSMIFVYSLSSNTIIRLDLATPWDITSTSKNSNEFNSSSTGWTGGLGSFPFIMNYYGTRLYALYGQELRKYKLTHPWDLSSMSLIRSTNRANIAVDENIVDLSIDESGKYINILAESGNIIELYFEGIENIHGNPLAELDISSLLLTKVPEKVYIEDYYVEAKGVIQEDAEPDFVGLKNIEVRRTVKNLARDSGVANLIVDVSVAPKINNGKDVLTLEEGDILRIDNTNGDLVNINTTGRLTYVQGEGYALIGDGIDSTMSTSSFSNFDYIAYSGDGSSIFVNGEGKVLEYGLGINYDILSANSTIINEFIIAEMPGNYEVNGVSFSEDGTRLFVAVNGYELDGFLYTYLLQNPWDIVGGSIIDTYEGVYEHNEPNDEPFVGGIREVAFSEDGTKMFIAQGPGGDNVLEFSLSSPWVPSSNTLVNTFYPKDDPKGLEFNNNGSILIVMDSGILLVYSLPTPWSLEGRILKESYPYSDNVSGHFGGVLLSPDGFTLYAIDGYSNELHSFSLATSFNSYNKYYIDTTGINSGIPKIALLPETSNIGFAIGSDNITLTDSVETFLLSNITVNIPEVELISTYEDFILPEGNSDRNIDTTIILEETSATITRISATTLIQ